MLPMRLPSATSDPSAARMPCPVLPEIRLPAPAALPPIAAGPGEAPAAVGESDRDYW